jgi:hypothetical protein
MLTRWLFLAALALAGCAAVAPQSRGLAVEVVGESPATVRMLLDGDEWMRITRAGIMDPSSPSGLTDRIRYRAALEAYVAQVLHARGLCPRGYSDLDVNPARAPYAAAVTLVCLPA